MRALGALTPRRHRTALPRERTASRLSTCTLIVVAWLLRPGAAAAAVRGERKRHKQQYRRCIVYDTRTVYHMHLRTGRTGLPRKPRATPPAVDLTCQTVILRGRYSRQQRR